jgi:hypothetical protein
MTGESKVNNLTAVLINVPKISSVRDFSWETKVAALRITTVDADVQEEVASNGKCKLAEGV